MQKKEWVDGPKRSPILVVNNPSHSCRLCISTPVLHVLIRVWKCGGGAQLSGFLPPTNFETLVGVLLFLYVSSTTLSHALLFIRVSVCEALRVCTESSFHIATSRYWLLLQGCALDTTTAGSSLVGKWSRTEHGRIISRRQYSRHCGRQRQDLKRSL